ncbi:MAG: GNAT family N-acetyltransferase [Roseicyclus sp.]|nr:GNAT family N-acetyltransferase [Roseicyclus sp.]
MNISPPQPGFQEHQRADAAALFWQAFGGKLGRLLGPEKKALAFLAPILDPTHCLSVSNTNGQLLGIAGFKTADGALVGGGTADLRKVYGIAGLLWRAPLLSMLEREVEPGLLLMDGIAVRPDARGLGIGATLLDAVLEEAKHRKLNAVRLDVIDTNPRARALYERRGFVAKDTQDVFPFRWLFGFSTATRMERLV